MTVDSVVLPLKGAPDIEVMADDILVNTVAPLQKALNNVKDKHNPFKKYPKLMVPEMLADEESGELKPTGKKIQEDDTQWLNRVGAEMEKQYERKKGESTEDYNLRVMALDVEDHFINVCYDYVCEICKIFDKPVPTFEVFGTCPIEKSRRFCYDILAIARINDPQGIFFPSRRAKEIEQSLRQSGD